MRLRNGWMAAVLFIILAAWGLVPAVKAAAELENGTYTIDYTVLKAENDSVSMANDYWEKPATLIVNNGKLTVQMRVNHSKWVTEFKVPSGSGFSDVKVISTDEKADKRLTEFNVNSLTEPVEAKIHVTVESIDYDHDYTVRFAFNTDKMKLVKAAAPPKSASSGQAGHKGSDKPAAPASGDKAESAKDAGNKADTAPGKSDTGAVSTDKPSGNANAKAPVGEADAKDSKSSKDDKASPNNKAPEEASHDKTAAAVAEKTEGPGSSTASGNDSSGSKTVMAEEAAAPMQDEKGADAGNTKDGEKAETAEVTGQAGLSEEADHAEKVGETTGTDKAVEAEAGQQGEATAALMENPKAGGNIPFSVLALILFIAAFFVIWKVKRGQKK
ncbi:heme uptake protein IsdC [Paenibacillus pinihumi]|uniref:heme uptake protein IsdC n=1 Tax=Paenibacillus pinihumi TaxID=669462 RepID=UPI001378C0F3|nr:heme uptake protein IsdC [Paenibacillus pinihumi]